MSPAHSSHSLSPTQSLGPTPENEIRNHPFPTPPNSLSQHHHSPSNCATPHLTQTSGNVHGEYNPQHTNITNGCSISNSQSAQHQSHSCVDIPGAAHNSPSDQNPTMLRSALTLERNPHTLHHHHQQRAPSQMHHHHHHSGAGGHNENRSEDCDDIDVNNVMPIVSPEFGSELCEVSYFLVSET